MHTETLSLEETHCFNPFFLDYIKEKESLKPYYKEFPRIENFKKIISEREFDASRRDLLYEVLSKQYQEMEVSQKLSANILSLKGPNTFTITTGHQLNIFTGPLFFHYKIITVINACKSLGKKYPDYHFIPLYWMASEDHDFEEISHFFLGNEKIEWKTNQKGAVGRFNPNGLLEIAQKLPGNFQYFKEAYAKKTLSEAVRYYVNQLYGEEGLLILDADDVRLKSSFKEIIKRDIIGGETLPQVSETSDNLMKLGYKPQINARDINFFYLEEGFRGRIERKGDQFRVIDTTLNFTQSDLLAMIDQHPERFSPNVTLRPVFQELVLPNLAYVGGPAEMVYWLQLKSLFDHYEVSYPVLIPRNYALIIPKFLQDKWAKIRLPFHYIFLDQEEIIKRWVHAFSNHNLSFQNEIQQLHLLIDSTQSKVAEVDTTLIPHLESIKVSFSNKLKQAEEKLIRSEKRKYKEKKQQIITVKEELFPNGTLQERKINFLQFAQQNPDFIKDLIEIFDPFRFEMYLVFE